MKTTEQQNKFDYVRTKLREKNIRIYNISRDNYQYFGIVSEIKDPQVHTNAFYNKCMQDLGGTPLIIDDKKTKRYCCCDRKQ